ncbi:MAG: hypothetical protein Q7S96_04190 [bacterium]|nr:hypothetical protein [bacterium]
MSYIIGASGQSIWCPPSRGDIFFLRFMVGALAITCLIGMYGIAAQAHFRTAADVRLDYRIAFDGEELGIHDIALDSDVMGVTSITCETISCLITLGSTDDDRVVTIGVVVDYRTTEREATWSYLGIREQQNLAGPAVGGEYVAIHALALQ